MGTSALRYLVSSALMGLVAVGLVSAQSAVPDGEWHAFGRDGANTKYSPLDQITAENFTDLKIAWRWTSLSQAVATEHERIRPGPFISSPLMASSLLRPTEPSRDCPSESAAARRRWRHRLRSVGDSDAAHHEPRRTELRRRRGQHAYDQRVR